MTQAWRQQWEQQGYLVVPGLFDPVRVAALRRLCERIWAHWRVCDPQTGRPGGGDRDGDPTCQRHLNHPAYFSAAGGPMVAESALGAEFCALMEAAADELVLGVGRALLGEPALFRCISFWHNPERRKEDGEWHRDLQFLHAGDEAAERRALETALANGTSSIQLQVALVASDDVEYVPGSHLRWDTAGEYALRAADGRAKNRSNAMPGAVRIGLQPGDAALFNPNGLHRGRYHCDKPRRTLMLTYTGQSTPLQDWFTDQPWFLAPDYLASLAPRTRAFFEPFVTQFQAQWSVLGATPAEVGVG